MRTIPFLVVDDEGVFDDITVAKRNPRRARLKAARASVLDAYDRYETAAPDLAALNTAVLSDEQKEALVHAYSVETAPMAALREDILERIAVARCPMCGISETSTLDHYLPKELYPEFSVFSLNLVPCCSPCNTRKRDKIVDENTNARLFIHPHFDQIPELPFLVVDTEIRENSLILNFRIARPTGMRQDVFRQLKDHFRLLGLADRYRRMALEHLGGQWRALRRAYGMAENAQRVADELTVQAEDFEDRYGDNYWLATLYRALAANVIFCDGGFEVLRS